MDYVTREAARNAIVALELPPIVLDIFDEKPLPSSIQHLYHEPYQIFCLDAHQQASYSSGRITPIWTDVGDYTITAYRHDQSVGRRGFFRFDIESGDEYPPIALSWQQILVEEFKFLWECEISDDELRRVAELFNFRYLDELTRELANNDFRTFEQDPQWYRSLLQRMKG